MNRGDRHVERYVYERVDEFGTHQDIQYVEFFWDGTRWQRGRPSRRLKRAWAEHDREAEEQAHREAAEQQRRHRRNLLLLLHRH